MFSNDHKLMLDIISNVSALGGFDSEDALLSRISREQGYGSMSAAFHDVFAGFKRGSQGNPLPANTDMQGLIFFTRPNLNLSYDNIMPIRTMSTLASSIPASYQRIIRRMLWPDNKVSEIQADNIIFDDRHAFMPLLSNTATQLSGWPDMQIHAYSSTEGLAKEVWMMNDSIHEINGRYTLNAQHENMLGDPITLLYLAWITYISCVYIGKMHPAGYSIRQNEMDYNTRIYRLVTDWSGQYVQKWAACGAAMPTAIGIGAAFDYSRDMPYNESLKQIPMAFECVGADYNDPITLWEFNKVVAIFNPGMADDVRSREFTKIPAHLNKLFNYRGFPWINFDNRNELEWWVDNSLYAEFLKGDLNAIASERVDVY